MHQDLNKTPIWFNQESDKQTEQNWSPYSIFVATPVHSEVSIHYTQALLELQKECYKRNTKVYFQLMKSSLVTQGRNLCVSAFLQSKATHLLFVDSDIDFNPESVFKMMAFEKDVISIPYPLKSVMWDKAFNGIEKGLYKTKEDLMNKGFNRYPLKVDDNENITINKGVMEVTHAPTGFMLIKREVFEKMKKAYPEMRIDQATIINGQEAKTPEMWNFFDTWFDPINHTYMGEDFAFCKRWKDTGGKCYAWIMDYITHVGEHSYRGRFADELILPK